MPIYMEISPLYRLVTIVARGKISVDEIRGAAQRLIDAQVPGYAKILEVAAAEVDFAAEHVAFLAKMMRGKGEERGPVALVVGSSGPAAARVYARATEHERPIATFRTLGEARVWLAEIARDKAEGGDADPGSDPDRQGTMFHGTRQRDVTVKQLG
jgi:hypothetical protein